eukprot:9886842-Prorocentrum_lima.AAC.1
MMMGDEDAIVLINKLHSAILRKVALITGTHHQGLSQVARAYRAQLGARAAKRLLALDAASGVVRHIT